ncbi:DUF58 domain-containing protein [Halolamina salifodinae]|uniref:Putative repeat protein (TIGR01451 family) n=1 Tax=Halolamina salifodinae TaxID=1202767 RepID=A0A8T4H071_9EURY|nr:DUF58 domain-containing protein [Halolamina salifodinae]MBP1987174.1 putative repeat protein (TIGR01451 family) [Halolamina salifodinae]
MSDATQRQREEQDATGSTATPTQSDGDATATSDEVRAVEREQETAGSALTLLRRVRRVGPWSVWLVGGFFLLALGLFYAEAALVAGAAIPFVYVGYAALSTLPSDLSLDVARSVDDRRLTPGDPVEVTVSVTNTGDSVLTDLRVVDGVPEELAVTEGSPRASLALRPGATGSVSYTVIAKRGDFAFGDARLVARSLLGTDTATLSATVGGADSVDCTDPAALEGLDQATKLRTGVTQSDRGGEGLEFHSTREYRAGDARNRVNWRQYAKTGDLVTTEFRQERAAREIVLLDVRPETRRSSAPTHPTGAEYAAYAAEAAIERYRGLGHRVSLAVLGINGSEVDVPVREAGDALWVENAGTETGQRAADAVFSAAADVAARRTAADTALSSLAEQESEPNRRAVSGLVAQFPERAELLIVSPLVDRVPLSYAKRAAVVGNAPTLLSPDPTGNKSAGGRLGGARRQIRLREARGVCDRVIDWPAERSLSAVAAAVDGGGR